MSDVNDKFESNFIIPKTVTENCSYTSQLRKYSQPVLFRTADDNNEK